MSRYDVYAMLGPNKAGYVVDVQADLLQDLDTRVVIPLLPAETAPRPARGLNPVFEIAGAPHVMLTQFIATVPARELRKPVLSLAAARDHILRALDLQLVGF